jgi:DNA-directed RNA polymerase specialized sigma24 family protein
MDKLCQCLDDVDRKLLELRLQGFSTAEVAAQTGHTAEALSIRLFRLRRRLAEQQVANEWL